MPQLICERKKRRCLRIELGELISASTPVNLADDAVVLISAVARFYALKQIDDFVPKRLARMSCSVPMPASN